MPRDETSLQCHPCRTGNHLWCDNCICPYCIEHYADEEETDAPDRPREAVGFSLEGRSLKLEEETLDVA